MSDATAVPAPADPGHVTNVYVTQPNTAALPPKSVGTAYILWFFLGLFGGHRFYLGKAGTGVIYLLTVGVVFVGWIIDAFTLPSQVRVVNARRAVGIK